MKLCELFNDYLDQLVRPRVQIFHRFWPVFQICGYTGLALAILLVLFLAIRLGLSLWVMVGIVLAAVLTFLGVAIAIKVIFKVERLIYYNFQIAVVIVTAIFVGGVDQPILPYLDVTILGIGLCLAFTRIGCLMVGCCHGRPCPLGVRYRAEHAAEGFTRHYMGIRLFPVQAVESLWVFSIILVGIILLLRDHQPGEILAWYVIAYGGGRFCFEFVRGDPERLYFWDFSEAQWTSLVLMSAVVGAEFSALLPFHWWHIGVLGYIVLTVIAIKIRRRFQATDKYHLLHPHHVKEVAKALELTSKLTPESFTISSIHVTCTSLGIKISTSKIKTATDCIYLYALSNKKGDMTRATARTIAKLILQLTQSSSSIEFIERSKGIFHLLVHYPIQELQSN